MFLEKCESDSPKVIDIKLYNNDCIKILKELGNKDEFLHSVDAVITDPPYNISRETHFSEMKNGSRLGMDFGEWDKGFNITEFINYLPPLLKENANVVIFNAWENLAEIKKVCALNNIEVKRCLVLRKRNPAPFNRDRMFVNDVEFALWGVYNSKGKPTGWTFNRENSLERCVMDATVQDSELHPTMKDLDVIKYLVRVLTKENDTVLDCFLGSGTTGLACKQLNRNFIGIELEKKYFDVANERINGDKRESLW